MEKEILLAAGGTAFITDESIRISYLRKRYALSSSVIGGGCRPILYAVNQKLTSYCKTEKDLPGGSVASYLTYRLTEEGCDPAQSTVLLTAARMDWFRHICFRDGPLTVEALTTAGVEKTAARAGDPALYREQDGHFQQAGTINIMLLTNASLPEGTMVRSLITATEAKTAALQDMGIAAVYTGHSATGTATDGLIIVTDPQGPVYTDAGTFSALGEMIARAVHATVTDCIALFDTPWNRFATLSTPPAVIQKSPSSGTGPCLAKTESKKSSLKSRSIT